MANQKRLTVNKPFAIFWGIVLSLLAATFLFLSFQSQPVQAPDSNNSSSATPAPTPITNYQFPVTSDQQNPFDLIGSQVQLQTKEYSYGTLIEGINGLQSDATHYWAIYLNGQYAQTGLSDLKLKTGDMLELKYETIQP